MSKAPDSPPRSRTRSRSRSRSYSRSQSRSRSRSRKRRYSSRSRSRSRSYSPSHRNYPSRDYQNNRGGFRPYNRGYRRPYYYRGRSRGYFPRGRYQNRGGGGGNYGYRANNWQGGGGGGGGGGGDRGGGGGGWHDQDHHSHSPRRGRSRSRSRTPRKRSGSRSRSRYSERSSSGRSRHSSYSSRSSSPRRRAGKGKPPKDAAKDPKDKDKPAEGAAPEAVGAVAEGASIEKASGGKWISYDASPKQTSPRAGGKEDAEGKGPASGLWRTIGGSGSAPSSKSPTESESAASFGGFGFFSKEDVKVTSAFKKFLAENKGKKAPADKENGREKEQSVGERELEKSKAAALFTTTFENPKEEKASPFFDASEEEFLKCHGLKDADEERADAKPKNTLTARDVFGKWGEEAGYAAAASSYAKEKGRRDNAEEDAEEEAEEEVYRVRKHTSKKEEKSKKKKEKERARRSPSPLGMQPRSSTSKERPLFPAALAPKEDSTAPRLSASRADFELKMSALDEMPSSLTKERHMPRDLAMPSKKEQEFRSIFQHIQSTQLLRNPTELFAQHIVAIVHYIKAQFFHSSDMSLSERFAMYQRKAAEVEMLKPRKSPEIHRRIDVSPSAFKRHSHLFEDMEASGYKDAGKKVKGDVMDLRLDIERRKRFAGKDRDYKRDGGKSSGGSRGPSRERSSEKSAKHHKKYKKSKKKRDRSPSSSSSSSSPSPYPPSFRGKDYMGEGAEPIEEGYHQRYPPRDYAGPPDRGPRDYEGHGMERGRGRGFFPRIRGRGWNRGNYPGNSNNGNPPVMNPPVRPPEEEWDPEYTPKSRKYYLHDDRDGEKTWVDNRGRGRGTFPPRRGRFVYRKGGGSSPKWTHDMYQGSEEGELADDGMEPEHKDKAGVDAPIPK